MGSEKVRDQAREEEKALGRAITGIGAAAFGIIFGFGITIGIILPW